MRMLSSTVVEEEPSEKALRRRARAVKWFRLRRNGARWWSSVRNADVGKIVQLGLLTHFAAGIRLWT